ncbi:sulfatase [uncultured Polaribacter sp.]|uniref:sulfatase n=1 Tax=uncultured Polaribacter sp. TaxID=174711 RepID=UPI002603372D|nr:sulfatase [uncultured Polaribacter sp.]
MSKEKILIGRLFILMQLVCMNMQILAQTTVSSKTNTKPNVLMIMVDDFREQAGFYGYSDMHTPNMDKLACDGVVFDRHYVTVPICIPSRAGLLTGTRSERTHQVYGPFMINDVEGIQYMGRTFSENGYFTAALGKVWHSPPKGKLMDRFDVKEKPGANKRYALKEHRTAKLKMDTPAVEGPLVVNDTCYTDGMLAQRTIGLLKEKAKADQPFLMCVGFSKPHLPFNAPKKYWDLYDGENPPATPLRLKSPKGMPDYGWRKRHGLWGYTEGWTFDAPPNKKESIRLRHAYAACISYVDAQIGKIINEVRSLGLDKNTIIVLWSDHGYHLGHLGMWTKNTNYEMTASSPLIISVPGMEKNKRTDALVETCDIFPTLMDLCDLPKLELTDGVSLKPLLGHPKKEWHDVAYHCSNRWVQNPDGTKSHMIGRAIRTDRYRYIEWYKGWNKGKIYEKELYDYKNDYEESKNLVTKSKYKKLVNTLSEQLWQWETLGKGIK